MSKSLKQWILLGVSAFSFVLAEGQAADTFEQVFPYYLEACAASQIRPAHLKDGGPNGHGVVYIKGLCRDARASFPQIAFCDELPQDLSAPDLLEGVGITADEAFQNVNWAGIPSKDLLFRGRLNPNEPLTHRAYEETLKAALSLGIFKGIEPHAEIKARDSRNPNWTDEEFIAHEGLDTNYALSFGRLSECIRYPVTREMLSPVIKYLNELNQKYFYGEQNYQWNGQADNCAHVVNNVFAQVGLLDWIEPHQLLRTDILTVPVPLNVVINLAKLSKADKEVRDVTSAFDNARTKNMIERFGIFPEHFALMRESVAQVEQVKADSLYRPTNHDYFILDFPFFKPNLKIFERMKVDPLQNDLRLNLLQSQKRYEKALTELKPLATYQSISKLEPFPSRPQNSFRHYPYRSPGFSRFYDAYRAAVQNELSQIRDAIGKLAFYP